MIASVDQHIIDRLKLVKKGGKSVTVYGPGPARPKGKMDTRCYIVSHYLPPQVDVDRSKPYLEEATPSEEQATVAYPKAVNEFGDPVMITGPDHWTFRKFRTPYVLSYQIDVVATTLVDSYALIIGLGEVMRMPYSPKINGCGVLMTMEGKPANLDEIEAPMFRSAYRYRVRNVWIESPFTWTVPGIKSIDMQMREL